MVSIDKEMDCTKLVFIYYNITTQYNVKDDSLSLSLSLSHLQSNQIIINKLW